MTCPSTRPTALVARVRRELPRTTIAYLAIKPSPARAEQLPRQQRANYALWRQVAASYLD